MKRILMKKGRRIFKLYFISYLAVALLVLSITGMASNLLFTRELYQTREKAARDKLTIANESLKKQLGILDAIATLSSVDSTFFPGNFQRGISYEMDMMKKIKGYENYFPIKIPYYLYYPELDSVYSYNAKYSMEGFLRYIYPQYQSTILKAMGQKEALLAVDENTALIIFGKTILRTPYYFMFFVPIHTLTEYVASMSGIAVDYLYLRIEGREAVNEGDFSYQVQSDYGVSLIMRADLEQPLDQLMGKLVFLFIVIGLVCLAIAVYFTYRNYQPIQKLISQYHLDIQENPDEFVLIDQHLAAVTTANNKSQEKLQEMTLLLREQQHMLRGHLLHQVLHQGLTPSMRKALKNVHISFPGSFTALIRIQGTGEERLPDLERNIEQLSVSEDMVFYPLPRENESPLFVMINASDRTNIFTAIDLVHTLLPADLSLQLLGVRDSLDDLFLLGKYMDPALQDTMGSPDVTQNEGKINDIIAEVESGNEKEVVAYVHEMELEMEIISSNSQTRLGQRAELASRLYQLTVQNNYTLAKEQITNSILATNSKDEYLAYIISAIRSLCRMFANDRGSRRSTEILEYIHDHLGDWELSLENVSNVFRVSPRIISADIKNATGMNYMEYVKAERMRRACKLLVETEDNVMEIGNAIGYINISYFIRVFREYTGMTPSIYRSTVSSLRQEE